MIDNTSEYISIQAKRAEGVLPEMGSSKRVLQIVLERNQNFKNNFSVADIGCATGHLYKSFLKRNMNVSKYLGIEIDPNMIAEGIRIWKESILEKKVFFKNSNIEYLNSDEQFNFVICLNAFMYFSNVKKAFEKMLDITGNFLIIRGYFCNQNYRILRPQTIENHDKSKVSELDIYNEDGTIKIYDQWNIYSFSFIEKILNKIDKNLNIEWVEDNNPVETILEEESLNLKKRGATEIYNNMEVSYPFIQPWKYLIISKK